MQTVPLVAIAMPIGEWHPLLPAALRSLKLQSATIELAILDASLDDRVRSALEQAEISPTYVRHGKDKGQSAAIAEGWANTKAPFVGWLKCDDVLFPEALTVLAHTARSRNADVVFGNSTIIDKAGTTLGAHGQVNHINSSIVRSNPISQPSCLTRRTSIEAVGGLDIARKFTMDWDLWIRLFLSGAKFLQIEDTCSAVYLGDETKTAQISWERLTEIYALTNAHIGPYSALKTVVSATIQTRWPHLALRSRRTSQTRGVFLAADRNPNEPAAEQRSIPIINTHGQAGEQLQLKLDGPAQVSVGGATKICDSNNSYATTFPTNTPPGKAETVTLSALGKSTRLRQAGFQIGGVENEGTAHHA